MNQLRKTIVKAFVLDRVYVIDFKHIVFWIWLNFIHFFTMQCTEDPNACPEELPFLLLYVLNEHIIQSIQPKAGSGRDMEFHIHVNVCPVRKPPRKAFVHWRMRGNGPGSRD